MKLRHPLKKLLHENFERRDKLLIILATFDRPIKIQEIKDAALNAGFKAIQNWNVSDILSKSKGLALQLPDGWELSTAGQDRLHELGAFHINIHAHKVRADLRAYTNGYSARPT